MKRTILAALLAAMLAGCGTPLVIPPAMPTKPAAKERPTVNLPRDLRQGNWRGPNKNEGSCTWASLISLLRWQGRYNTANWVRENCGDGEWATTMASQLNDIDVRYAYVTNGDVKFLEWACATRRGCAITVQGGKHMVALVHLDDQWAALLDNNDVSRYRWIPRETLIAEWKASNGWAITPIYTPAAPLPQ
jgi:predicted small lipoprotein YifL/ABC-type bacteriocin/lantibiotic exporter with double-glycine peptidase domain